MSRKSSKIVRKTAADIHKPSDEELDRLEALPEGTPDEESPEWTTAQIAAAERRRRILEQAGRARKQRITINIDEDLLAYF